MNWIIWTFLALIIVGIIAIYNALVLARNQIDKIIGTMDAMFKKRWDLVPNLVVAVKCYLEHERGIFE